MFWYKYHFDPPTNSFSCSLSIIWWERKGSWNVILVYKAYLYRSYVSQTEDCRPGCSAAVLQCCRGELHTLHCHEAAAVTTCHVSHVSTYPMVAGAGHRSGHAEKLQLWRILWLAGSLCHGCCHVCRVLAAGHVSRVTCHTGEAGAASRSPGHPRCCWHMCAHWCRCSLCSGQWSPPRTASLRGWDRSAVGQLGSPPAVVLAASLAAAYWHGLYWLQTAASRGPARRQPPPARTARLPQLAASLEPRTAAVTSSPAA